MGAGRAASRAARGPRRGRSGQAADGEWAADACPAPPDGVRPGAPLPRGGRGLAASPGRGGGTAPEGSRRRLPWIGAGGTSPFVGGPSCTAGARPSDGGIRESAQPLRCARRPGRGELPGIGAPDAHGGDRGGPPFPPDRWRAGRHRRARRRSRTKAIQPVEIPRRTNTPCRSGAGRGCGLRATPTISSERPRRRGPRHLGPSGRRGLDVARASAAARSRHRVDPRTRPRPDVPGPPGGPAAPYDVGTLSRLGHGPGPRPSCGRPSR